MSLDDQTDSLDGVEWATLTVLGMLLSNNNQVVTKYKSIDLCESIYRLLVLAYVFNGLEVNWSLKIILFGKQSNFFGSLKGKQAKFVAIYG